MVRIREAYKQKIHLHINQGMLKRLWDKYVPADAPEYGNIDLFYLGSSAKGAERQSGQANILFSLVLKNRMMQMGLEEAPVKTAFVQAQMWNSLQRMERFYLTQLKCCDFVMYRNVNRFVELLDQAQAGGRNYKEWKIVSRAVEKQRDRYRLFSLFAADLKGFFIEHSRQALRTAEKNVLETLTKKEYREFCRLCRQEVYAAHSGREVSAADGNGWEVKWKKSKDKMRGFLEEAEDAQIRRLWVQLEHLAASDKQAESENANALLFAKLMQIGHHYLQEVAAGFWEHAFEAAGKKNFREAAKLSGIPWKELERRFVREKRQRRSDDMGYLEAVAREYQSKSGENEYLEALKKINQAEPVEKEHLESAESVNHSESGQKQFLTDGKPERQALKEGNLLSGESVIQCMEEVRLSLQAEREQLVQREAQAFASYREIYRGVSATMFRQYQVERKKAQGLFMQIRKLQAAERTALIEKLAAAVLMQGEANPAGGQSSNRQMGAWKAEVASQSHTGVMDVPGQREIHGTEDAGKKDGGVIAGFTQKEIEQLLSYIASVMEKKAERIFAGRLPRDTEEIRSRNMQYEGRNAAEALVHRTDGSGGAAKQDASGREAKATEKELLQIAAAAKRMAGKIASQQTGSVHRQTEKNISRLLEDAGRAAAEREAQDAGTTRESNEGIHIGAADVTEWEAEALFRQIMEVIEQKEAEKISGYAWEGVEEAFSLISDKRAEENTSSLAEEVGRAEAAEQAMEAAKTEAAEQAEEANAKAEEKTAEAAQWLQQGISEPAWIPYQRLWEWGEALLFHPEHGRETAEADILPGWQDALPLPGEGEQREMASGEGSREYSGNQAKEDIQTEIIRSQIAAAKSRNTLQQLISQINHKAASELPGETGGKKGWPDEAWGKEDAGSELLVYADSQLGTPKIRELLQFVQKLDESQYGRLIEELSEVTAQQRMLYFGRKAEGAEEKILEHLAAGENREVLAMIRMRNEKQYETLTEKLSEVISSADGRASADRAAFDGNRPGGQFLASAYPMLVYRIRQYEARRQRTIHEDMQRVRQAYYRQEGNLSESRQFPAGVRSSGEPANLGHRTNAGNAWERISPTNDLQYSVQDVVDSEEERKRDMMRGRQENAQLISTQEQLGKKLKEVEAQLEKVETAAKAKEDVRAFAEQVKKQLYEELHVEKLRRGLI